MLKKNHNSFLHLLFTLCISLEMFLMFFKTTRMMTIHRAKYEIPDQHIELIN